MPQKPLEGLLKLRSLGPTPTVSNSVGLEGGPKFAFLQVSRQVQGPRLLNLCLGSSPRPQGQGGLTVPSLGSASRRVTREGGTLPWLRENQTKISRSSRNHFHSAPIGRSLMMEPPPVMQGRCGLERPPALRPWWGFSY